MAKQRITVQVLIGATGEVREVVANVAAGNEQAAVDVLFEKARRDDYYYRFLGANGIVNPTNGGCSLDHNNQEYWCRQ